MFIATNKSIHVGKHADFLYLADTIALKSVIFQANVSLLEVLKNL